MTTTQQPTKTPSATDQMYFDLFTTALEGGIGYWSQCSKYRWSNEDGSEDVRGFIAVIHDADEWDEDEPTTWVVDRKVIARGYQLAARTPEGLKLRWSVERPPFIITKDVDWDFDADDADMIVQLGLFGRTIYG